MGNWRYAIFLGNCRVISALRLNFVTPDGIGHSSSGFWKSIVSAGYGRILLHLTNETLPLSNSCPARPTFSICVCLAITQQNTTSMADTSIVTKSCYGNAKLHLKVGRSKLSGIFPKCATSGHSLDRKSTRLNSSHLGISYAVFCLKKK